MNKIGLKIGLITLFISGLISLTNNLAFAMCAKANAQADPNKKQTCSCCCCDCCK